MIPYLKPALIAIAALGAFTAGWKANGWRHDSEALAIERAAQKAGESATAAAVTAIANIKIQRVTVRQELEREIRLLPADGKCDLPDGVFKALNTAITGKDSDSVSVPGTDATDRPAVRDAHP